MRLNWMEFQNACRRFKTNLCVPAMWRALDSNLSGWVSIREFDERAFNLLGGFKVWTQAKSAQELCTSHFPARTTCQFSRDSSRLQSLTFHITLHPLAP